MKQLLERYDIRVLGRAKIAALGKGTERELNRYGLRADLIPAVYDGGALGRELAARLIPGMTVLIPRAAIGNHELIDELNRVNNLTLLDIATYDTIYESSQVFDEKAEFESGSIDYAVFTSASTVKGFAEAVKGLDFTCVKAICIGRQTKAAADALGMQTWMSEKATMDSVAAKLEEVVAAKKA